MQLMAYNAVIIYYDFYTIRGNSITISTIDKNLILILTLYHGILTAYNASQLVLPFFLPKRPIFVHRGALFKGRLGKKRLLTCTAHGVSHAR